MKLAYSIAAAWMVFDLVAGKAILSVIAPIDAELWHQIVHMIAIAAR